MVHVRIFALGNLSNLNLVVLHFLSLVNFSHHPAVRRVADRGMPSVACRIATAQRKLREFFACPL